MEKDTNKSILIVSIDNKNRLNATITEDYFLVDSKDYQKAVDAFEDADEMVFTTSGAMAILNGAGVDYERVIQGQRLFFKNNVTAITYDYEDGGDCEE